DAGVKLGLGQGGARWLALAPMVVGVEFDDVGTGGDLVADSADRLVYPGDFLRALRDRDAGLETLGAVGTARDDGLGGDEQPRTRGDALVDRLLEADIGKSGALGAKIAFGRETGVKRPFCLD